MAKTTSAHDIMTANRQNFIHRMIPDGFRPLEKNEVIKEGDLSWTMFDNVFKPSKFTGCNAIITECTIRKIDQGMKLSEPINGVWDVVSRVGNPKSSGDYVVTIKTLFGTPLSGALHYNKTQEKWKCDSGAYFDGTVIAWQPMPEPYSEVINEISR